MLLVNYFRAFLFTVAVVFRILVVIFYVVDRLWSTFFAEDDNLVVIITILAVFFFPKKLQLWRRRSNGFCHVVLFCNKILF